MRISVLMVAQLLALVLTSGCMTPLVFDEQAWRDKVESTSVADLYAVHRDDDGEFFNPWAPNKPSGFLRWRFSHDSLAHVEGRVGPTPVVPNDGAYLTDPGAPPSVTHIGHATFAIDFSGQVVITDPFFSDYVVIIKREVPPAFGPDAIPDDSVVLISHNHYDHLDADSVEALAPRTTFLVPLGLKEFVQDYGGKRVFELDWWESVEVDGTKFTCLPVQHWSRRLWQGRNETLWAAWMIERGDHVVYFGGDSGYFKGYSEIGRKFPGIDVALLPIGAYEPRWFMHYAHTNIPEALAAFSDLGAQYMVPTQWGVLRLGDGPSGYPVVELERALEREYSDLKNRVKIIPIGGRLILE